MYTHIGQHVAKIYIKNKYVLSNIRHAPIKKAPGDRRGLKGREDPRGEISNHGDCSCIKVYTTAKLSIYSAQRDCNGQRNYARTFIRRNDI